jgi:nitroreductase
MDTLSAIRGRRAINFFDPGRKMEIDELKEILSLASLAPSSFNLQPWEVIIVHSPAQKALLRRCAFNQAKVEEASAVFIIIANPDAVEQNIDAVVESRVRQGYTKEEDREKTKRGPQKQYGEPGSLTRSIFAVKNASFFAMNCMIAAGGMGCETHPMDGFSSDDIKKEFGLPDNRIIPVIIAVGYPSPDISLLERPARFAVDDFARVDRY